jgi:hypothetical protein
MATEDGDDVDDLVPEKELCVRRVMALVLLKTDLLPLQTRTPLRTITLGGLNQQRKQQQQETIKGGGFGFLNYFMTVKECEAKMRRETKTLKKLLYRNKNTHRSTLYYRKLKESLKKLLQFFQLDPGDLVQQLCQSISPPSPSPSSPLVFQLMEEKHIEILKFSLEALSDLVFDLKMTLISAAGMVGTQLRAGFFLPFSVTSFSILSTQFTLCDTLLSALQSFFSDFNSISSTLSTLPPTPSSSPSLLDSILTELKECPLSSPIAPLTPTPRTPLISPQPRASNSTPATTTHTLTTLPSLQTRNKVLPPTPVTTSTSASSSTPAPTTSTVTHLTLPKPSSTIPKIQSIVDNHLISSISFKGVKKGRDVGQKRLKPQSTEVKQPKKQQNQVAPRTPPASTTPTPTLTSATPSPTQIKKNKSKQQTTGTTLIQKKQKEISQPQLQVPQPQAKKQQPKGMKAQQQSSAKEQRIPQTKPVTTQPMKSQQEKSIEEGEKRKKSKELQRKEVGQKRTIDNIMSSLLPTSQQSSFSKRKKQ